MENNISVSVIIVTYNTQEMTAECIESVFEHTKTIPFEVILIDNKSTDGSKEFFEQDHRIKYAYSPENVGFGRANNIGFAIACGKYIFCLNSDTKLQNNAIKLFFDYAESHSDNAIYGCWLKNEAGEYHSYSLFPSFSDTLKSALIPYTKHIPGIDLRTRESIIRQNEVHGLDSYEVDNIMGADLFIPQRLLEEYGIFDHDYFMYFEDTDLEYRFKENGIKRIIINGPQIIHYSGASTGKDKRQRNFKVERWWMESRYRFLKKQNSRIKYFLFKIIFILLRLPVIVLDRKIEWNEKKKNIISLIR